MIIKFPFSTNVQSALSHICLFQCSINEVGTPSPQVTGYTGGPYNILQPLLILSKRIKKNFKKIRDQETSLTATKTGGKTAEFCGSSVVNITCISSTKEDRGVNVGQPEYE